MVPGKPTDPEPARRYDQRARDFAGSGGVERAGRAVADPGDEAAERAARGRAAEIERNTPAGDGVWKRIAAALRRDWEQTKSHVFPSAAPHLGQTAGDTVRQAAGRQEIPCGEQPNPPDTGDSWSDAEPAIRFGHDAVTRYPDDSGWSSELEERLRRDWLAARPSGCAAPWTRARQLVRYGWDYRRKRML